MKNFILLLALISQMAITASAGPVNLALSRIRNLDTELTFSVPTGEFQQRLDHFNPNDSRRFDQRYWVSSYYAKTEDAPTIYYICGEGTCDGATGTPFVNTLARQYGAHRVALEHRYYGYSVPNQSLSSNNLKYLSTDQAIEDLAEFQKYLRDAKGLKGKWIAVGGSYPGNLAAYYRLKHPELVSGALASSAPVKAKVNFEEYDRHVAQVTGAECLNHLQLAVKDIEGRMQTAEGTQAVKKLFSAEMVKDDRDFLYIAADMAALAIQYGFHERFCSALKSGHENGTLVESYARFGVSALSQFGMTPLQISFQGAESIDPNDYLSWAGMRSWMYQSCTEYGFFQTAYRDARYSTRSSRIDLSYHFETCGRLFGIYTRLQASTMNDRYLEPLLERKTSQIFFTNGKNDPWSVLSVSNTDVSRNPNLFYMLIPGAAHCDDLGSGNSGALVQARNTFMSLVAKWLN